MKLKPALTSASLTRLSVIMLLASSLTLSADAFDFDEVDDYLTDWNPDVTAFENFGSGTPPAKLFSFEPLPKLNAQAEADKKLIAADETPKAEITAEEASQQEGAPPRTILINFNNVAITEFIRFISRVSGRNFVYEEADLQFNVTIVSDEPATLENVMAALMQILRINGLSLIEQGNNIIIHKNAKVTGISKVVSEGQLQIDSRTSEIVTQVFRLNTLDTAQAVKLIKPLASDSAIVDEIPQSSNIVVTDLSTNVQKIGQLLKNLDSPVSGLIIGQFQVTNGIIEALIPLAEQIMQPIAEGKPLVLVPHVTSNSIFIVSTPFLVERTIAVLRNLDMNTGSTRIFTEENLKFLPGGAGGAGGLGAGGIGGQGAGGGAGGAAGAGGAGQGAGGLGAEGANGVNVQEYDAQGNPQAGGGYDAFGNPIRRGLQPGQTGSESNLEYLRRQQGFAPGSIGAENAWNNTLPAGHIQRTQFYIQKLKFRNGEQIVDALQRIAESLARSGLSNADLVSTIQSIQWIEASNSLVFTGTAESLLKVRELINEIDTPLRQVFIEMLIMETDLIDSLQYGVNWGARFGGGNTAGAEVFASGNNPINALMNTAGVGKTPSGVPATVLNGYSLGIIGQRITHGGTEFASIGALVRAVHDKSSVNVVLNPKILTEDNVPAELFVGINTRFQTQSIANDQGNIVTNNFEFRDIGTTLKVTPLISNTDVVTLEIKQEVSRIIPLTNTSGGGVANIPPGPDTTKNTTTTRVHVPNKFFLVLSGMMDERQDRTRSQVPCLGGAPLIGALASEKTLRTEKRNLMIFIRPEIIDTEEEIEHLTRHQQNLYRQKNRSMKMWQLETDEAMDWMNIRKPDNSDCDREEYNP